MSGIADALPVEPEIVVPDTELDDEFCEDEEDDSFLEDTFAEDRSEEDDSFFSFLDTPQQVISSGVEAFAKTMDEFFSEDKAFYDRSGTFLRLRTDIIRDERGAVHTVADFRLKLRMPNTKKKVNVVVESDTDTRKDEVASPTDTTPVEQQDKKKYFIGVQGSVGKQEHWRFKPSVGLRLSSDVNVYVKFRISRLYEFDKWSFHFNENFYSFRTTGSGADTSFDISNKVNENTLFRSSSLARWTHETQYFELSQTFSMLHTLSKRRAVSYYIGAYGKSEPVTHATHYLIGASYRQNIHKDYLFVELIPQIQFKKINNFDAEYSFILRLEMIFKK